MIAFSSKNIHKRVKIQDSVESKKTLNQWFSQAMIPKKIPHTKRQIEKQGTIYVTHVMATKNKNLLI